MVAIKRRENRIKWYRLNYAKLGTHLVFAMMILAIMCGKHQQLQHEYVSPSASIAINT